MRKNIAKYLFGLQGVVTPPLSVVRNQVGVSPRKQEIPPTVYQVWISDRVPTTLHASILRFRELNPSLNFVLWTKADVDKYMAEEWGHHEIFDIFASSVLGPSRADIFRYCLIYDRGGYYCDINKGARADISTLHSAESEGIISFEKNACLVTPPRDAMDKVLMPTKYVSNWVFGFNPKHPLLKILIENIIEYSPYFRGKYFENPKEQIVSFTGPGMFTRTCWQATSEQWWSGVEQAGVDLWGNGIPELRGSKLRYFQAPPYSLEKNVQILR